MFVLWLITTIVFCAGDLLWIYAVMNSYFVPRIAHLMNITESGYAINYSAALFAYILLTAGLCWFVVMPGIKAPYNTIFLNGALFGLCVYGVYDCTNYASLKGWPLSFACVDVAWGMVWCGATSVLTIFIMRYFLKI